MTRQGMLLWILMRIVSKHGSWRASWPLASVHDSSAWCLLQTRRKYAQILIAQKFPFGNPETVPTHHLGLTSLAHLPLSATSSTLNSANACLSSLVIVWTQAKPHQVNQANRPPFDFARCGLGRRHRGLCVKAAHVTPPRSPALRSRQSA